jgi:hypothetical protein
MDLLLLTTSQTIMQCLIMYIYMHCFSSAIINTLLQLPYTKPTPHTTVKLLNQRHSIISCAGGVNFSSVRETSITERYNNQAKPPREEPLLHYIDTIWIVAESTIHYQNQPTDTC